MNRPALLSGVFTLSCLAVLYGIALQRSQLTRLRAEERRLLAQVTPTPESPTFPTRAQTIAVSPETRSAASPVPSELLRLRNKVTRLTERQRELAGARAENEGLRTQLASQSTNAIAGIRTPPGYLRKTEARLVGYNTPDDTIQSFLWAIQSRDLTNLLQAFTPDVAEGIRDLVLQSNRSIDDYYFRQAEVVPGMAILSRKEQPDGAVELELEIGPGVPHERTTLRQVGGQWKIDKPF